MENVPATNTSTTAASSQVPLATMQNNIARQPIMKQIGFLLAIAASIALGGYVLVWSQSPNYQVLFNGLAAKESSEIVAVLQQSDIDYKLNHSTGAVMVPASKVQSLKLKLAAEGLPKSVSPGMEMLSEDQGFGTSQFVERARYQHALEEELSRSIAAINNVRSARVHLAVPKQSVFVRNRKPPSASVVLNLYAGRRLEPNQVAAITHMVASSVPDMTNSDITVVDQRGNLLTQPERSTGLAMSDNQLQYTQKLEQSYISRIEDILAPIVGLNGMRAQVVADVDFTVTEQTRESYNPDIAVMRSEQIQEEKRLGNTGGAIGIPGALSNQPPVDGQAPESFTMTEGQNLDPETNSSLPTSSSKQSTRNFELDRTISHTREAPGTIRKLNVAVLVDEKREPGTTESTPLSEAEMSRISALIMDAIGFNKARGDSLNIVNAPFVAPIVEEPLPEPAIWQQPWLWDVVKQVSGGLLVLFLILGVIRPAFRDLNRSNSTDAGSQSGTASLNDQRQNAGSDNAGMMSEQTRITTGSENVEGQLNNVRSLVQQDPALVAQVVKNWTMSEQ